jgi:hypothetical protein
MDLAAMDATTRQIIAFHVGDRSRESAKALWARSPRFIKSMPRFTRAHRRYLGVNRGAPPKRSRGRPGKQSYRRFYHTLATPCAPVRDIVFSKKARFTSGLSNSPLPLQPGKSGALPCSITPDDLTLSPSEKRINAIAPRLVPRHSSNMLSMYVFLMARTRGAEHVPIESLPSYAASLIIPSNYRKSGGIADFALFLAA